MSAGARIFTTVVVLIAGNFLYQAMFAHDWSAAVERSWFQVIAGGLIWFNLRGLPSCREPVTKVLVVGGTDA